jgi:hypothetical protein
MARGAVEARIVPDWHSKSAIILPLAHVANVIACPALVAVSRWREADRWKQWRARTGDVRFREMFLSRHNPDLGAGRV